MLLVPVVVRTAPTAVVVRSLHGGASYDSCWEDPVAPSGHLAVYGPLGCLSIVGGRHSRSAESHLPYRNPRNVGNCHYGSSCCRGNSHPLGDSRRLGGNCHLGGNPLSAGSRNRDGCRHRACSLRRGSSRHTNRGCHLCIYNGDGVS